MTDSILFSRDFRNFTSVIVTAITLIIAISANRTKECTEYYYTGKIMEWFIIVFGVQIIILTLYFVLRDRLNLYFIYTMDILVQTLNGTFIFSAVFLGADCDKIPNLLFALQVYSMTAMLSAPVISCIPLACKWTMDRYQTILSAEPVVLNNV